MRGSKQSFTSKKPLPFEDDVVEFHTRAYPLKRKIAIGFWTLMLMASAALALRCFSLFEEHVDYLLRVDFALMANYQFDMQRGSFFIPIFDYARYPTALLTLWLGWRTLKALFIAPVVRKEHMRISMVPVESEEET